jgi:hypothetical protein
MLPLERTGAFTLACVAVFLILAVAMALVSLGRLARQPADYAVYEQESQPDQRQQTQIAHSAHYPSRRSPDWVKMKNPEALAVKGEAVEEWGR